jgi:hypothetical protein
MQARHRVLGNSRLAAAQNSRSSVVTLGRRVMPTQGVDLMAQHSDFTVFEITFFDTSCS